jgi:hypothetical protein
MAAPIAASIANLEELAGAAAPVNDLANLRAYHLSTALLDQQEAFFTYVDRLLLWVNYEGCFRSGAIRNRVVGRPAAVAKPALYL